MALRSSVTAIATVSASVSVSAAVLVSTSACATGTAAFAAASVPPTGTSQGVARHASLACRSISRIVTTLFPEREPGDGAGNLQGWVAHSMPR